jgi:baseplate hub protein gp41
MTGQQSYLRKCSLIVYGTPPVPSGTGIAIPDSTGGAPLPPFAGTQISVTKSLPPTAADQQGIDLSNLRIQFKVTAMDVDAPPTATIRVINPSDNTAQRIQKEFQSVTLQAGYENGNFGVIFQGTILRVKRGRLNNIESFVDIMASNLDAVYNFGVVAKTLKKGASLLDQTNAIAASVNSSAAAQVGGSLQYSNLPSDLGTGGTLPRGKVLFGMARDKLNDVSDTNGSTWSVGPDGKVQILKLTGYAPGEAVVITSTTGMVGVPEATTQGIEVKCLLNPMIKIGTRIQLDNASINQTTNNSAIGFPAYGDFQFFASESNDGTYRALVVEHEGDTRGPGADWITSIVALNVSASAPPATSVLAYG